MNGYIAFWRGERAEVYAKGMSEAKDAAVTEFTRWNGVVGARKVKRYEVAVVLAEVDGKTVEHSGEAFIF